MIIIGEPKFREFYSLIFLLNNAEKSITKKDGYLIWNLVFVPSAICIENLIHITPKMQIKSLKFVMIAINQIYSSRIIHE